MWRKEDRYRQAGSFLWLCGWYLQRLSLVSFHCFYRRITREQISLAQIGLHSLKAFIASFIIKHFLNLMFLRFLIIIICLGRVIVIIEASKL